MASSRQMMSWAAQRAPHHVGLPCCTRPVVWYCPDGSPHLYSRAYEWSAEPVLHYSGLSTRLVGHNDTAYPRVL
jgi:hypothetical protein